MQEKEDFLGLLAKLSNGERPERIREYKEILANDKILDKWDFTTVCRNLTASQKDNAVLYTFRALTKAGKSLKEILTILEEMG